MTENLMLRSSVPNQIGDVVVAIVTWFADELHVGVTNPQGATSFHTLHLGDAIPGAHGLRLADIKRPPTLPPYAVSTCVGPHLWAAELCRAEEYDTIAHSRLTPGSPKEKFMRDMEEWARFHPEPGGDGKSAMDHGGNPADAFTMITGKPGSTATLANLGPDRVREIIGGPFPAVVATGLFTAEHPSWQLARQWGVFFDVAYPAKGVLPDGRIQVATPWGFGDPHPMPVDVLTALFVGLYWLEI